MSELDLDDLTRIAQEAASEMSPAVKVMGVILAGGGTDYVELLVNLEGCRAEPCRFSLGVFRNASEATLKREISAHLRRHLDEHRSSPEPS
jgi:hypothetical protein